MKVAALLVCLINLFSCSNRLNNVLDHTLLNVDSIYVNVIERSDTIRYDPLIVYYFTIKNLGAGNINIQVEDFSSDIQPDARFYLINRRDTINLYLATDKSIKVSRNGSFHFGMATNTFKVVDLLEKYGYSIGGKSKTTKVGEVEFLKKIARESSILIVWQNCKGTIKNLTRIKIKFKNPQEEELID